MQKAPRPSVGVLFGYFCYPQLYIDIIITIYYKQTMVRFILKQQNSFFYYFSSNPGGNFEF